MINRSTDRLVIEGPVVPESAPTGEESAADQTVRSRIEIDLKTGLIDAVTPLEGPAGSGLVGGSTAESGAGSRTSAELGGEAAGAGVEPSRADLVLDDRYVIFPGFIDAHVHAREDVTGRDNYKEDFETAGAAALQGGITVYVEMPNNPTPPRDAESYLAKRALTEKSAAKVLLYAIVGADTEPMAMSVPYKAYMAQSIGDFFFSDEEMLRRVLPRYRGNFMAFHAEHPEILLNYEGAGDHYAQRPRHAEVEAIDLALKLCEANGIECHICHLSTAEGLDLIREAKSRGQKVTTEVTPHHLFWDLENYKTFGHPSYLQCNPPIRTPHDREVLLEGLRVGDIDFLATDHAPHTVEEKDAGMSGVTHLDTYGNFVFWLLEHGLTLQDIRRVSCENPGRFVARYLGERYGRIEPGFVGSLTVLEREPTTIRRASLKTRAGWSCFEGQTFGGRVSHTIIRGDIHPQCESVSST